MNPYLVSQSVQKTLQDYMTKYRPVHNHDPELGRELTKYFESEEGRFVSHTYVEKLPYYVADKNTTLETLAEEGLILPETAQLFAAYFRPDDETPQPALCPLYAHQKKAVEAVQQPNQHLLVCTGTGSGKTESFLLPLIDSIMRERRRVANARRAGDLNATYTKGVRAMILYPMNALVSDQLLRIRRIFMGAEKHQIDYARDITFGTYTGELKTINQEADPIVPDSDSARLLRETQMQANAAEFPCAHPFLSADDCPANEYSRRSEWLAEEDGGKGPADILITNYAMLERLLVDPRQSALFSPTWRFIVLDEAHTYNGAQGTEISWLLRRVRDRLRHGETEAPLTFMATSATLIDTDRKDVFESESQAFARKLFHTEANFTVLRGDTLHHAWPRVEEEASPRSYRELMATPADAAIGAIIHDSLLSKAMETPTLVQQTRWYDEAQSWLRKVRGKEYLWSRTNSALGDAIALAELYTQLPPELVYGFLPKASQQLEMASLIALSLPPAVEELLGCVEKDALEAELARYVDPLNKKETARIRRELESLRDSSRTGSICQCQASSLMYLGVLLNHASSLIEMEGGDELDLAPLTWRVQWHPNALQLMRLALEKAISTLSTELAILRGELRRAWRQALGLPALKPESELAEEEKKRHREESYRTDISLYLTQKRHQVADLAAYLQNPEITAAQWKTSTLAAQLFPALGREAEKEFSDFAQFMALSEHSAALRSKPLMDLRYHQVVNTPSSTYVYFTKKDDKVQVHVPPLRETEMTEYEGHRLYQLGVCFDCAQPYILGYMGRKDLQKRDFGAGQKKGSARREEAVLNRYKSKNSYYLQAFSWTPGVHDEEEREEDDSRYPCWLEYQTGRVLWQESCPTPEENYIALHHYAFTKAPGETSSVQDTSDLLSRCPACGQSSRISSGYGMIDPFSMGTQAARIAVMNTVIAQADPTFSAVPTPARGRKLLAFSDSRAAAANVVVRYESYTEQNLMLHLLKRAFRHVHQLRNNEEALRAEFLSLREAARNQEKDNDTFKLLRLDDFLRGEPATPVPAAPAAVNIFNLFGATQPQQAAAPPAERPCEKLRGDLTLLLPQLIADLHRAGALRLLNKETPPTPLRNEEGKVIGYDFTHFSETDSAWLAAMKVLRTSTSHWNDIYDSLRVYSHKHRSALYARDWEKVSRLFTSDDAAQTFFDEVYLYLFLHCSLNCEGISSEGKKYAAEIQESLNGYTRATKRVIVREKAAHTDSEFAFIGTKNGKLRTMLRKHLPCKSASYDGSDDDWEKAVLTHLFSYMKDNAFLIANEHSSGNYLHLNATDVRFEWMENTPPADTPDKEAVSFRIEEHTAQLNKDGGRLHQRQFTNGAINILSCSTTFEMGVDLGDLNCVMLCNMPPCVSNYKQRAGRAGRRAGASAYVLTFIGDSSHDAYYRTNPEMLFFGKVVPPRIYDNKSFRAKHLRAVALHEFLSYVERDSWKHCGRFFCGERAGNPIGGGRKPQEGSTRTARENKTSCVYHLRDWLTDCEKEVQKQCRRIVGEPIGYSVARDLCIQLVGLQSVREWEGPAGCEQPHAWSFTEQQYCPEGVSSEKRLPGLHQQEHFFLELSGAFVPTRSGGEDTGVNLWQSSLLRRYRNQHQHPMEEYCKNPANRQLRRNFLRCRQMDTIQFLAHARVLPTYGFPCDVVELKPFKDDADNHVALQRDLRMAIYEYAPGNSVVANKKVYTSQYVIQYTHEGGRKKDNKATADAFFYYCPNCRKYEMAPSEPLEEEALCAACSEAEGEPVEREHIRAVRPDAFGAGPAQSAKWHVGKRKRNLRIVDFIGELSNTHWRVPGLNLCGHESPNRTILYLNRLNVRHDGTTNSDNAAGYDALYHMVHTDIVIWTEGHRLSDALCEEAWGKAYALMNKERLHRAWNSATQAIVKAAGIRFGMLNREIGGMFKPDFNGQDCIVLYDNSQGGSGAILQLIKTGEKDESYATLTKEILLQALSLTRGDNCPCAQLSSEEGRKKLVSHAEYLNATPEQRRTRREYRACYRCLRSHENQTEHETLDSYDASVILRHLLGEATHAHKAESPVAEAAMLPSEPPASPPTPPADEVTARPELTEAQQEKWEEMQQGLVPPGKRLRVMLEGQPAEVFFSRATETHAICFIPGREDISISPDQLII